VIHSRARARLQAEAKAKGRHSGYGERVITVVLRAAGAAAGMVAAGAAVTPAAGEVAGAGQQRQWEQRTQEAAAGGSSWGEQLQVEAGAGPARTRGAPWRIRGGRGWQRRGQQHEVANQGPGCERCKQWQCSSALGTACCVHLEQRQTASRGAAAMPVHGCSGAAAAAGSSTEQQLRTLVK
jgi:hypothetical protein